MATNNPLFLLLAPVWYIILSCFSLLQFQLLFNAITSITYQWERTPALDAVAPVARAFVRYLENVFGPAYKFTPNPTQVLLVAVIIAYIANR